MDRRFGSGIRSGMVLVEADLTSDICPGRGVVSKDECGAGHVVRIAADRSGSGLRNLSFKNGKITSRGFFLANFLFRPQFPVIMAGYPTPRIPDFRVNPYGSRAGRRHENCKLRDRIDLHVEVPLVDFRELSSNAATGEKSETIRARVVQARRIQTERFRKSSNSTNSAMSPRQMKAHCQIDSESTSYLEHAMEEMNFSARAHDRILKVARTLADLAGAPNIRATDVLEAIQYRSLDRKLFS